MKTTTTITSLLALFSFWIVSPTIGQQIPTAYLVCLNDFTALFECIGFDLTNPDASLLEECQACIETKLNTDADADVDAAANRTISCDELDEQVMVGTSACTAECQLGTCDVELVENAFSCVFENTVNCTTGELIVNITEIEDALEGTDAPVMAPVAEPPASDASISGLALGAFMAALFMNW